MSVLGIIENMSYFQCPDCGSRHAIFGEGGGQRLADEGEVELLGQIPIETIVRKGATLACLSWRATPIR